MMPERIIWAAFAGGPYHDTLGKLEDLLANLTASYLYRLRLVCDGGDLCDGPVRWSGRTNLTVYYNGFVGDVKVSPWRAVAGFVASLILFGVSLIILGVRPVDRQSQAVVTEAPSHLKSNEPIETGLLDILRLGGPGVLNGALEVDGRPVGEGGHNSDRLTDLRVRYVFILC